MKGLTLTRPWELAMTPPGPKGIENRTWPPPKSLVGKRFALHAGQKFDDKAAEWIRGVWPEMRATDSRPGLIVAVAMLDGAHQFESCNSGPIDTCPVCSSRWAFGPWCWALRDRIALPLPVPYRGAQGLWTLPPDVETAVLAQIGGA